MAGLSEGKPAPLPSLAPGLGFSKARFEPRCVLLFPRAPSPALASLLCAGESSSSPRLPRLGDTMPSEMSGAAQVGRGWPANPGFRLLQRSAALRLCFTQRCLLGGLTASGKVSRFSSLSSLAVTQPEASFPWVSVQVCCCACTSAPVLLPQPYPWSGDEPPAWAGSRRGCQGHLVLHPPAARE